MKHLFLSPHFDDAVLSCGATIHQLVRAGHAVEVRTIMAGIPVRLPVSSIVQELHARWQEGQNPVTARIQEDTRAVERLGAKCTRLSYWLDCIYRTSRSGQVLYADQDSIFADIHPDDLAAQLVPTIALPGNETPNVIYAPLGAGHHVDHQIVRNWAVTLKQYTPWVALKFYEEYPYTKDPLAVDRAMTIFTQHFPWLPLELERVAVDEQAVQAKLQAIACYTSQLSSFWPDHDTMESETRQSLLGAGEGQYAERYWTAAS